ncbi:MAG: hypothetical protein ISR52_02180 [Rhodospirillales bacterium]|nr:hypothetical protein [Rhodospirillales bacterium]
MAKTGIKKSTRVQRAQERLSQAIDKLEDAVKSRTNGGAGADPEMVAELAVIRAENDSLKDVNKAVSDRLDAAISRMKSVLEG